MKPPPSQSLEPPPLVYRKIGSVDIGSSNVDNGIHYSDRTMSSTGTAKNAETRKLLKRVCLLLETRVYKEEEQRYKTDKENEMKNDWMLAAAVLDRICAIAVTVLFVPGTVVLFVLFAKHT